MGFFGWNTPLRAGEAEQPRHMVVVDIDRALRASRHSIAMWAEARKHPETSPFSGGSYDAWPAWAVDAISVCRDEEFAIRAFYRNKE